MKVRLIAALLVIVSLLGGAAYLYWPFQREKGVLKLPGIVEIQEVRLASKVGGRIDKVLVEEGQIAEAGRELVRIELPELQAQRDQIQARLDAAQANYDKVYNGPRAEEREAVKRAMEASKARLDRMEAGYRPEKVEAMREEMRSMEAELEKAKRDVEREKKLLPTLASSSAQYDMAVTSVNRLSAMIRSMKAKTEMMASGYRKEEKSEMRAEFERLKAQYQLIESGSRSEEKIEALAVVSELKAKLREVEAMLAEGVIVAPEKCVVEVIAVRRGDIVAPNAPVIRVLRAEDLWVKAYISEIDLGKIRLNQEVDVSCDAYPGQKFNGIIRACGQGLDKIGDFG
jgi:multidrug resistance efflux pump